MAQFSGRLCLGFLLASLLPLPALAESARPPAFQAEAVLLIDLLDGAVLYAKNADEERSPASLVKLMTLYLAYEDLRAGRVGLREPVVISARAARTPRHRMGLRAGERVPLRVLLEGVAIASANDAAAALAEHLEGSEAVFAERMNATGAGLGLSHTRFVNPHGLPDPLQRSTARDLARLTERLLTDFPEARDLLSRWAFAYRGRVYRRRTPRLDDLDGVIALKTGYTLESGFNVAVAAARNGRRLLCVVLGAESRQASFLEAGRLLELGFGDWPPADVLKPRRGRSQN